MKRNKPLFKHTVRLTLVVLAASITTLMTGCSTVKIKVAPDARIQNPSGQKIPLTVGLMLHEPFYDYRFVAESGGLAYPFGGPLMPHTVSLCEQTFQTVIISSNDVVPAGVNVTLTPEVHRCGIGYAPHSAGENIILLLQWTMRTADNQRILWRTTVDARGNLKRPKVYQQLFDDLATKSYRAFQDSPEIKQLAAGGGV
jgi:hypothetical protein